MAPRAPGLLAAAAAVLALSRTVVAQGALPYPWSVSPDFPLPPRPFIPDCANAGLPLPVGDVVFDWDASCGFNTTSKLWASKVGGYVANATDAAYTLDSIRGVGRILLSGGRHVVLPVDIRPSAYADFTMEMLASAGAVSAATFRALWTTEEPGTATPAARGRAGLVYDQAGAGAVHSPWCASSTGSSRIPLGSG
jgi:hypothetical protein